VVASTGAPTGLQYYDYSHDGMVDLVYSVQNQAAKAFRNNGVGFTEDSAMETQLTALSPFQGTQGSSNTASTVAMADINGDGIVDLIPISSSTGQGTSFYLGGWCPLDECSTEDTNHNANGLLLSDGMLIYWIGPLGEEVELGYDRAPRDLQLPSYVVSFLLRAEARDDQQIPFIEEYDFSYSGGQYTNRMFFGFSNVTETDPNGNTVVDTYDQSQIFAGQVDSESVFDSSNNLRYQKNNTWTALSIYQGALTSTTEIYSDP